MYRSSVIPANKISGKKVVDSRGKKVGKITEVRIDKKTREATHVIISAIAGLNTPPITFTTCIKNLNYSIARDLFLLTQPIMRPGLAS